MGDDGNVYAKPADVPSGYKAVAMVANVYKDDNNVVHRLAIALEDESGGQMTQSAASTAASGHSSITIGERTITWRLPTLADWKKMFIGCGNGASIEATEVNYTCFNAKLATVGTALKNDYYWSSIGTNYLFFNGTKVKMDNYDVEGLAHYARACFEF